MGAAMELQLHMAPHTHTCEGHPCPQLLPAPLAALRWAAPEAAGGSCGWGAAA